SACSVVSINEDKERRAQRSAAFDSQAYVAHNWNSRIVPEIQHDAVPLAKVLPAIAANLDAAGRAHGRIASEGAPYVFKVSGLGKIAMIDRSSRTGSITLFLGALTNKQARLLIGPVLVNSDIRDSLPFIDFNNFADQSAFAAINRALNTMALRALPTDLKVGDTIRFIGVMSVARADAPVEIMPVQVERAN
ncbi:MAG: DUF2291 domain-containing protein, partial [Alphaproteobacteria bacterium]|nr:DUF2291 domain-containing protein [Alphaproteobacteria bacterium]